jgi:hypothetical protein
MKPIQSTWVRRSRCPASLLQKAPHAKLHLNEPAASLLDCAKGAEAFLDEGHFHQESHAAIGFQGYSPATLRAPQLGIALSPGTA